MYFSRQMWHSELKSFPVWALSKQLTLKYFVVTMTVLFCSHIQMFYVQLQQLWQERWRWAVPQAQGICLAQEFLSSVPALRWAPGRSILSFNDVSSSAWYLFTVQGTSTQYLFPCAPHSYKFFPIMIHVSLSGKFIAKREFSEVRFLISFPV